MNAALNTLERKNINIIDHLQDKEDNVVNEIMIALSQEGELTNREIEAFSYVFDVIKEEYQNIDHSDISLSQSQERKNLLSKSKLDFTLSVYSKFISSYGAAVVASVSAGSVIGSLAYLAVIPTFLTPIAAKKIKYNEYVENKKYGTERIVKNFLDKMNLGYGYLSHGDTFNRMDAYRRKIAYFKETVSKRIDYNYKDNNKALRGLKLFLGKISKEFIDALTFVNGGGKINQRLREAEKELNKLMGGTKNMKAAYEKINDEMYNEYLSRKTEEYLVYLVNERVDLQNQEKELKKGGKIKYFERSHSDIVNVSLKIKDNEKEIKKISKLRKLTYLTNEKESVYYAGASMLATAVLDEIERTKTRESKLEKFNSENIKSLVGSGYKREIMLEKKKALLRIKSKKLAKELDIDPESNEELLIFKKCLSIVMSSNEEVDIKERIESILENNIDDENKLAIAKIRYFDFVENFNNEFKTFNSKPIDTVKELDDCFEEKIRDLIEKNQPSKIRGKERKNKNI